MYLCTIYCTSRVPLSNLGKLFSVSVSGIARTRDRVKEKMSTKKNQTLMKAIDEIKKSTA